MIVLAAIDESEVADQVLVAARRLAELLGANVVALHVANDGEVPRVTLPDSVQIRVASGDPVTVILDRSEDPDVVLTVVGAKTDEADDRPLGHIAEAVLTRARRPVLVVGPRSRPLPEREAIRVLVPVDGYTATSEAVAETLARLVESGAVLVAVHVLDPAHAPRFWDHPAHVTHSWRAEFSRRWCHDPESELRLRRGDAPTCVHELVEEEGIDLIVLGWAQSLEPGRAGLVRGVLDRAELPVLLVPLATDRVEAGPDQALGPW
jgi:nucleotide-binding universal stress UspA family protein